jgi:hypothetical protein
VAINTYAIAIGNSATAEGSYSSALGYGVTAGGGYSTAIGNGANAGGQSSVAIGLSSKATSLGSLAFGIFAESNGTYSTAMGNYVKTNHAGSFIIGDRSESSYDSSSALNEMTMRFAGGYRLFTNAACSTGVYMAAGNSGWTNYCDRNKKENFRPIDGEQILIKIKEMPITEWNYKGVDPSVKYIGPVAQDFFAAFKLGGKDSLGINSICMDGINIAAAQALEKRTAELKTAVIELQHANEKIAAMEKRIEKLEQMISLPINNKEQ